MRVLERDQPGAHASSAAAGMLAPLAESEGRGPLFALGSAALAEFPEVAQELGSESGIDVGWVQRGLVRLYRKDAPPAELPGREPAARHSLPLGIERWDGRQLRERFPGVAPEFESAHFSPYEGVVDPVRLTRAYRIAAERFGAIFECDQEVTGLITDSDRVTGVRTRQGPHWAAHVLWCGGAWSGMLELPGGHLPVEPVKGQMLELESSTLRTGPLIWDDRTYLVLRDDGFVRVGATVERVGFDVEVRLGGVRELVNAAVSVWPRLAEARLVRSWAGLRPVTPDGLPLVGPCPGLRGISVATGHGRHGILLSAITARRVRSCVLREPTAGPELPWEALDPARVDLASLPGVRNSGSDSFG